MPVSPSDRPVFRFAPSPNGVLHLGHALSAFLNSDMAQAEDGRLLLRIEDIDLSRCTPDFEAAVYHDLAWLGIGWEIPVRRQSEHFDAYQGVLKTLIDRGLAYPAFMTRGEVKALVAAFEALGKTWPRDPDGSPLYPEDDKHRSAAEQATLIEAGARHAWRLDMEKATDIMPGLTWIETGDEMQGVLPADPAAWGDVVLSRSDAPSSYHLSVVVDDALQGVTHIVRGLDLFHSTSVHRLLQALLGLPQPIYHHHRLVVDILGKKLSKSEGSTGITALRDEGLSPGDIRRMVGL